VVYSLEIRGGKVRSRWVEVHRMQTLADASGYQVASQRDGVAADTAAQVGQPAGGESGSLDRRDNLVGRLL
jgi:hypothetical protein